MAAIVALRPHPSAKGMALAEIRGGRLDGPGWAAYAQIGKFDALARARAFRAADLEGVVAQLTPVVGVAVDDALREGVKAAAEARDARAAQAVERCAAAETRSGRTLYGYQRDGAQWLASRSAALLADEMGTGKTAQALIAAGDRLVVVCPASLRRNWLREAAMWRPDLRVALLEGLGSFRWPRAGEAVVLGYESLPATAEEIAELTADAAKKPLSAAKAKTLAAGVLGGGAPAGVVVLADEGHLLKGSVRKTDRVARFRAIAQAARAAGGSSWVLTATPLLNRPMELWNLAMAAGVAGEAFGNFERFKRIAGGRQGRFALEWHADLVDVDAMSRALKPVMLRRLKRDVLTQLPPKVRQIAEVSLTSLKATEAKVLDRALASIAGTDVAARIAAEVELDESMPSFEGLSRAMSLLGKLKFEAAEELLASYEEAGEPIVVFSTHQATVDALCEREGWVGFHGASTDAQRDAAVQAFQGGRAKGIALTILAGGVGITLTRARTAIFLERSWTPALDAQAEDRIHRIGQEAESVTYVTVLADHPLDQRITELQETKRLFALGVDDAARKLGESAYVPQAEAILPGTVDLALWQAEWDRDERERAVVIEAAREDEAQRKRAAREAEIERRRALRKENLRRGQAARSHELRGPKDEREVWVQAQILSLAAQDGDRARLRNDVGFSVSTTGDGHALAWTADLGWTDAQWTTAAALVRYHHRQVGRYGDDV